MNDIPHRRNNLIARHWRGELPLWISYWVLGFLSGVAILALAVFLHEFLAPRNDFVPLRVFLAYLLYWVFSCVFFIWQSVGIWRSAGHYREAKRQAGRSAFWAGLARFGLVIGALSFIGSLYGQAIPQLREATKIAFLGDPDIPAYQLRLMRNDTEIEITGGFKYGLADDFQRAIAATPHLRVVHLNSPGGRIGEATKLNRIIGERGLATYTSRGCLSACVVAFVGGRERWLGNEGKLGFHAGSFAGMNVDFAQRTLAPVGATPAFIQHASITPSTSMWYPTTDELLANKIITGVATPYMFAMSGYGPNISQEEMATEFKTVPLLAALAETHPQFFQSLIKTFHENYVEGATEGAARDKMRATFMPFIRSLIPIADEASIISLAKLTTDQYAALELRDPKLCFQYASGTSSANFSAYYPAELAKRETALYLDIVHTADASAHSAPTEAQLRPYQLEVYRQLLLKFPKEKVDVLFKPNVGQDEYAAYCDDAIAMMDAIVALGDPGGPMMIRSIYLKLRGPAK